MVNLPEFAAISETASSRSLTALSPRISLSSLGNTTRMTHLMEINGLLTHFLKSRFPNAVLHRSNTPTSDPFSDPSSMFLRTSRLAIVLPLSDMADRLEKWEKELEWRKRVERVKALRWDMRAERAMSTREGRSKMLVRSAGKD
jgi:hypothetical protein